MSEEEIKEYLKRFDELELKLTDEDKDTYQWLLFGYNKCARLLNEKEQENKILKENAEHNDKVVDKVNWEIQLLKKENKELKKQLEYLRSGEYYNQLRFENEMLQQVVDTNGVPSEVYDYIDCTHRNTELLDVIEEVREYTKSHFKTIAADEEAQGLLQILDKAMEN